ncbi:unnamed protein product [Adineta ricciae]|uniref:Acyltransferase 3 domain-containing protein n=2 Tax=Adineta ricciae TaxID=249248 RepID=A0A815AL04_ADIRI|nr:unnamed protein product [Adineta ricciae]
MLSGFLLTYKLISKWNRKWLNYEDFLVKEYPLLVIKRVFRFWPGFILVTLILLIFGEPIYPNANYLIEFLRNCNLWLFFQNYINTDYWYFTFSPLWSISLDMQIHILLPLFLYLFYSKQKYLSMNKSLVILVLLSIVQVMIVFNPQTMSIASIGHRYSSFRVLSSPFLNQWLETKYNLTKFSPTSELIPLKLFMENVYLPLGCRFGSFIIGSILAIKIFQCQSKSYPNKKSKWQIMKKYLFFGMISFHLLSLLQTADVPPNPPDIFLKFLIGISRQLFTIGQAFLLFTTLCPQTHPYHSSRLKSFLSARFWIPISKLSYFTYLIHIRIAFQLIVHGPLRLFKTYSITYATLLTLPIVLLLSQVISTIWFVFIDKPIERFINKQFLQHRTTKSI